MTQLPNHSMDSAQIGHYTLLSSLGRGGMGLVYLARDTRLDRQVAIKCLRAELIEPHYRERFKREALLLAKLNHPHIVQIYDYLETNEQLALVMEYVDGQNLQQHLREHIVSQAQRMQWLAQIAQGLAVAHDAGIIHRDLKAENILINKHKLAKITDLGIAKSQDFSGTLTDHVTGSYSSMSPEQAMGEELDYRSDLFSFGILAYQLLCGAHPFGEAENKLQLMQRIISHPAISPLKKNPDLLPEAVELLGQLLSKDPNIRPDSTHWVAAQCEKLYQVMAVNSEAETNSTQILPHSPTDPSGVLKRKNSSGRTQEHSTFDTSIAKKSAPLAQRAKIYIRNNSITLGFIGITIAILAGRVIWQLQPKAPKYVAVIPPTLSTTNMPEAQQALVKGAIYDAMQQSVLQMEGYYLIPPTSIEQMLVSDGKQQTALETIWKATAADELLSAELKCEVDACEIQLARLTPEGTPSENTQKLNRLRLANTKKVDVLTNSFLALQETVASNVAGFYDHQRQADNNQMSEKEYNQFLDISLRYKHQGADKVLLEELDRLSPAIFATSAVQEIYRKISLDLFYGQNNKSILTQLEQRLTPLNTKHQTAASLHNHFYLQIAQKDFNAANNTLTALKTFNIGAATINELAGYKALAHKEYTQAIGYFQKALATKSTSQSYYYLALSYWRAGNTQKAQEHLNQALILSPNFYDANELYGAISLLHGDMQKAIMHFNAGLTIKPNDIYNLTNLGISYLLTKNYPQAKIHFNKVVNLAPNVSTHWLNLADVENLLDNSSNATNLYEKIIQLPNLQTKQREDLSSLAQAFAHTHNLTAALTALEQLEQLDPENVLTIYTAALIHTRAQNTASALFKVEAALKQGLHPVWFELPWFDALCKTQQFQLFMQSYDATQRCAALNTTGDQL